MAPLPKRCREERSDDRVIRLVAPGKTGWPVVLLVFGSAAALGTSRSAEREPDGGAAAHRALTRDMRPSAQPSRSLPSTSATRRRRLMARRARCQLDTGRIRPSPRSLPRAWSRTQDQEDDRPTRLASRTNRITRSSLRSSLRRFGSGAHDVIPDLRSVLTSGLASLAAGAIRPKGRRPHAPARRTVRPPARHVARHAARRRAVAARRALRGERRWPSSWQPGWLPSACKRFGHAARPPGRRAGRSRRASEASPGVSTALKAGMTPWHRFRSGAGRSEATTASYGSSRLARRVGLSSSWSSGRLQLWARAVRLSTSPMAAQPLIGRWRAT